MTQTNNKLFDEFAKLMTDASGVAQGMRREVETMVRGQAERFLADMDIVKREDFDAAMELAANARKEADGLAERVSALEARVAELEGSGAAPKKPAKKPAAKPASKA
ncbi:accessory factor UbiK family protein [Rhodobium gokarnense]|uniref:BMFP domain-containing protein YqiC n=1 Tax=Rhodobium gokarnense TaxID=364296 RepID=A0ABT3H5T1_9HYPH|nr:accessory factor UbiK family protein [Rhodobium gokarnense]MCW2305747.1 BMFP domain-containing protein YqiC [Rhodobium gokarnense]